MIYFVRHGECQANADDVFAGRNDSPLTEKGHIQAQTAGEELQDKHIQIKQIVSSPLKRTLKTAEIIAAIIDFEGQIQTDPRLLEYDMGSLTGTPHRHIKSAELVVAEGVEDVTVFKNRVIEVITELQEQPGNTLVVSHAGVGRILEIARQNKNPRDFYDLPPYPNGAIIELPKI